MLQIILINQFPKIYSMLNCICLYSISPRIRLVLKLTLISNFLPVDFEVNLMVITAMLTILGFSVHDSIVVFDRIREVRGKSPSITDVMINTSINQTLGRTLLTSLTTLMVVVILYALGGAGIHGFAFALVVGVMVGTYSSIFVASPALLWMARRAVARGDTV